MNQSPLLEVKQLNAWYDRSHVIVDWSAEQSGTYRFTLGLVQTTGVSFWNQDLADPDAVLHALDELRRALDARWSDRAAAAAGARR